MARAGIQIGMQNESLIECFELEVEDLALFVVFCYMWLTAMGSTIQKIQTMQTMKRSDVTRSRSLRIQMPHGGRLEYFRMIETVKFIAKINHDVLPTKLTM